MDTIYQNIAEKVRYKECVKDNEKYYLKIEFPKYDNVRKVLLYIPLDEITYYYLVKRLNTFTKEMSIRVVASLLYLKYDVKKLVDM